MKFQDAYCVFTSNEAKEHIAKNRNFLSALVDCDTFFRVMSTFFSDTRYIRYCSLICYHIYGKNRVISRYCNSGLNAILAQIEQVHPNENTHQNVVS